MWIVRDVNSVVEVDERVAYNVKVDSRRENDKQQAGENYETLVCLIFLVFPIHSTHDSGVAVSKQVLYTNPDTPACRRSVRYQVQSVGSNPIAECALEGPQELFTYLL